MEDEKIIQLYWARDEAAIPATAEKYGAYCGAIAGRILESPEDREECLNDTYLAAWNAMPPHRPRVLATFLGKLTRNLAINRAREQAAAKRGGGALPLVLEELGECVSGGESVEQALDRQELTRALNGFLATLPQEKRQLFLGRYWYMESVGELARRFGMTENRVSVTLHRLRGKLRRYLIERGVSV